MQGDLVEILRGLVGRQFGFLLAVLVLLVGAVLAYAVWWSVRRALTETGIDETVEGTPFERTARRFGTSTIGVVSTLVALSVFAGAVVVALSIVSLPDQGVTNVWSNITAYLPQLFIAALAVVIGLVVGDKAGMVVGERLRSIKLPEVGIIPMLVKYSVFYVAALIALGQLGVATGALLVLLGVYLVGLVLLVLVAFRDLLQAGAAGIYILLNQPYGIGDRVRIEDVEGIVQEVDMFTTHIENDDAEYIVPNQQVFRAGIVRLRE